MLKNYLKTAFRNIKKYKLYSFINISGLAVGMACCILIFLWIQDEISYDRFHQHKDRLYRVVSSLEGEWTSTSPWAINDVLKKDFPEVIRSTRFRTFHFLTDRQEKSHYEDVGFVDLDFLHMFSFPLLRGDPETALSSRESVVITKEAAQRYFKNEDPLGKFLTVNNSIDLKVTGILKDVPSNSTLQFDMLAPVKLLGEEKLRTWALETSAYVMLEKNVSLQELRFKISGTTMKYDKRIENQTVVNDLQPISRMHLHGLNDAGGILYIYIFSGIAVIILLIACINFINLTTAKSGKRAVEVGMRKVIGAQRSHLIKQFFGEAVFISLVAFLLAILLVSLFLPSFNQLTQKQLTFDPVENSTLILILLGTALFTGIVSGSYPALLFSSFSPIQALRESGSLSFKSPVLRRVLVIFQFTVAVGLIFSAIVLQKQMTFIRNKDLGFDRSHVLRLPMNKDVQGHYQAFKQSLVKNADILNVTSATNTPLSIGNINPVYWEGRGPDQYEVMNFAAVDYDYFETFQMDLTKGRTFSRDFATDEKNYIINEAAVRFTGLGSPIGKLFSIWKREGRIIGVVKDFHSRSLHDEIKPVVFTLTTNWSHNYIFVRINPERIQPALQTVQSSWKQFASGYPFEYVFLDDVFERQYQTDQRMGLIINDFTLLAIFLSCLGLFGLASYMAERRTKEIGIRKVLGASVSSVALMLSKDFTRWVLIANAIAWPVAWYVMSRWMQNYAYRIRISWWMFFLAGGLALIIALLTVGYQSVKAATANPGDSLRYE
ncbi:MAG: FtsX-like permease family protein [Candidatus Aminicenantes bacterium]|nr:FtsX-like permease family protein [Candidatus Aminicenantes bacterium]